jgi:hypothetical protein
MPIANQVWLIASPASGVAALSSAEYPAIAAWSGAVAYSAGAIVTASDGNQYQAVAANTNIAPPAPGTWTRSAYASPDKGLLAASAIPLDYVPVWDGATAFPAGASVLYGANQFTTPTGAVGTPPPSVPGNNSAWEYVGAAGRTYGASFYVAGDTYSATLYAGIEYYGADGSLIAVPSGKAPGGAVIALPLYQRFAADLAELDGTSGNTLILPWTGNPTGFWQVSAGVLSKNLLWTGAQKIKLLYVADARADCCVGVTHQSEVVNFAVEDVGILFRLSDTSNYWMASRGMIQKVVGGVLSTVATYTRLPVGSRFFVQAVGSTIRLYTYPGAGAAPSLVTTVTDAFNATATRHGLYDQVF